MTLLDRLDEVVYEDGKQCVIAITGGGGKTTTLIALAQYYRNRGLSVLVSTTTKMQNPSHYRFEVDHVMTDEKDFFNHEVKKGESVLFVQKHIMNAKKCMAPRDEILPLISKRFDVSIFEADGARCLPLKKHRECDPVIPSSVTAVIAIGGMSCFNKMAADNCMGEADMSKKVDVKYLQDLIDDEEGMLKRVNGDHKSVILLNQCDLLSQEDLDRLRFLVAPCPILLGSVEENTTY